jgi:hypothetical protein
MNGGADIAAEYFCELGEEIVADAVAKELAIRVGRVFPKADLLFDGVG